MSEPLHEILRACAGAAPTPWYPKTGPLPPDMGREEVDAGLERLRLGGLVTLTEWVAGHGQGYVLTPDGVRALADPGLLRDLGMKPPRDVNSALDEDRPARSTTWERGEAVREALLTSAAPVVSFALIALNVGVFLLAESGTKVRGQPLDDFLALHRGDVVQGGWRWLRVLSCCFVHGGGMHLFMNMWGVYAVGPMLERMFGRLRFLALYLISGVGGSCVAVAQMLVRPGGADGLVGASGALWGSMAALAIWVFLNREYLPPQLRRSWASNLLTVFILNVVVSFLPGISAAAHFGGGAVGAVCALMLHGQRFGGIVLRPLSLIGVVALPLLCLAGVAVARERSPNRAAFRELARQEEAKRQERRDDDERLDFNGALNQAVPLESAALGRYKEHVEGLLGKHPTRRGERAVAEALVALEQGRANLQMAVEGLGSAGPFQAERVKAAHRLKLELLNARLELFAVSKRVLEAGEDAKPEDDTRLGKAAERVRDLEKDYQAALRAS